MERVPLTRLFFSFFLSVCLPPLWGRGLFPASEKKVHPRFDLTGEELTELLKDAPPALREAVKNREFLFLDLAVRMLTEKEGFFRLVDKSHPLPPDYRPEDPVSSRDIPALKTTRVLEFSRVLLPALLRMNRAAADQGITLVLGSAFRSYSYQNRVFASIVRRIGQKQAERESARPGHSQHQLGTALDFAPISDDFTRTPAGLWLSEHAGEYGFSLSYPRGGEEETGYRFESWHFRYLGVPACRMQELFFQNVQQRLLVFWNRYRGKLEAALIPESS